MLFRSVELEVVLSYLIFTNWRHQSRLHVNPQALRNYVHPIFPFNIFIRWMNNSRSPGPLSHADVSLAINVSQKNLKQTLPKHKRILPCIAPSHGEASSIGPSSSSSTLHVPSPVSILAAQGGFKAASRFELGRE